MTFDLCKRCLKPIIPQDCTETLNTRQFCLCTRPIPYVTFKASLIDVNAGRYSIRQAIPTAFHRACQDLDLHP